MEPILHFTGQVWRPPYESRSQLLQVTSGCTYSKCKFCSLYHGTRFRMSPISEIESDLAVIQEYQPFARRLFLTGANPFALSYNRLLNLGLLFRKYLPRLENIGCFARVTDIKSKSTEELRNLRHLGFYGISIGTESGDDDVLVRMNKGYTATDIVEQCHRLDEVGIRYNVVYLSGLSGRGGCLENAERSATVFNQIRPFIVNVVSLTVFPESQLFDEMQQGLFVEAGEKERLKELYVLISQLDIRTTVFANTVSNVVPFSGMLPNDKAMILKKIDGALNCLDENNMRTYRNNIESL